MTTADFNNDGRPDLAVASYISDTVSVLLGNGSGGFAAKTDFTTGRNPISVNTEDFNNDGRPDLAVTNYNSSNVSVLLGDAAATVYPSLRRHAFGRVALGQSSSSKQITFRNGGGARLQVGIAQLTGADDVDFVILNDDCSGVTLKVEESCSISVRFEPEAEGFAQARLRLTSTAPDSPRTIALTGFPVEITPPDTTIDAGPTGPTGDSTPTFEFSSSEPGSSFECRVGSDAFASCPSPETVAALSDGPHTFEVKATDPAGNQDPTPATRTFTVDTNPPDTTIDAGPTGPTGDSTPTFEFSSSPGSSFECRVGSDAFASCPSPETVAALSDGLHTFEVKATDPAGNQDPTPATRTFTVDTTPPDTTIDAGPTGPTGDSTPTFEFSSSEPGSSFECRVGSDAFASCSSPETVAALSDGPHTFEVKATDPAGNQDPTPATRTFTVDTTPPDTTIDTGPSGTIAVDQATFTFAGHPAGDTSTFQCQVDDQPFADCLGGKTFTGLAEGSHTATFRAEDAAGNQDPTPATRTFTVDTTVYKAKISKLSVKGPAKAKRGKKATYKVTVTNSGNADATGVALIVNGKGVKAKKSVGMIRAGALKAVKVRLKFKKPGKIKVSFKVTSGNADGKTAKKNITVKK